MEGDKGGNFSKAPKSLFLLKIKIKQNSGYPNKVYNAISLSIPKFKKICDWENQMIGKMLINIWKNPSKVSCWRRS